MNRWSGPREVNSIYTFDRLYNVNGLGMMHNVHGLWNEQKAKECTYIDNLLNVEIIY